MENWDEDWIICPVCSGTVVDEEKDGVIIRRVTHLDIDNTLH